MPLKTGNVIAEGDLDFRGTLGVDKEAPVGFAEIRLRFDVDTDAPQDKLDLLLKLTERYCVVYQTIKNGPKVSVSMQQGVSRPATPPPCGEVARERWGCHETTPVVPLPPPPDCPRTSPGHPPRKGEG